jgi:hypothetical protein
MPKPQKEHQQFGVSGWAAADTMLRIREIVEHHLLFAEHPKLVD